MMSLITRKPFACVVTNTSMRRSAASESSPNRFHARAVENSEKSRAVAIAVPIPDPCPSIFALRMNFSDRLAPSREARQLARVVGLMDLSPFPMLRIHEGNNDVEGTGGRQWEIGAGHLVKESNLWFEC